jgi:serine/threonine protein kinase
MVEPGDILLGHHEIRKPAGRGGLADVYLAYDRLRRAAAVVKVLHEDLAEGPEFVHRFKCEAKALAHLNHPNIVRFYGIEQQARVAFIVKDYIVRMAAI